MHTIKRIAGWTMHAIGWTAQMVGWSALAAISLVLTVRCLLGIHYDMVDQALGVPNAAVEVADPVMPAPPEEIDISFRPDLSDVRSLALTMWGEARSEGVTGMTAVGHVILNRRAKASIEATLADQPPVTIVDIVYADRQFSVFNSGIAPRPPAGDLQWLAAVELARQILAGQTTDPTAGAQFYHTVSCESSGCAMMRAHGVRPAQIGSHVFYRAMRRAA